MLCQRCSDFERYWTWKRMYIRSPRTALPGIEPRMPIVSGLFFVSQTLTVAHSSGESKIEGGLRLTTASAAGASAASRGASRATARARAMRKPNITCYLSHMAATTDDEAVSLLSGVPVFETLGPRELTRIAQLAVPRRFQPGHVVFREGDSSDTCYIVRSGHATVQTPARSVTRRANSRRRTATGIGPPARFRSIRANCTVKVKACPIAGERLQLARPVGNRFVWSVEMFAISWEGGYHWSIQS